MLCLVERMTAPKVHAVKLDAKPDLSLSVQSAQVWVALHHGNTFDEGSYWNQNADEGMFFACVMQAASAVGTREYCPPRHPAHAYRTRTVIATISLAAHDDVARNISLNPKP
jgi:hypothetical protein